MSTLAPATIADTLFAELQAAMDAGGFDSPFTRARLLRDAEKLQAVDPAAGLLARAGLAAVDRDAGTVHQRVDAALRLQSDASLCGQAALILFAAGLIPDAAERLAGYCERFAGNGEALANIATLLAGSGRLAAALDLARRFSHLSSRLSAMAAVLPETLGDFHRRGITEADCSALAETVWQTFRAFGHGRFVGRLRGLMSRSGEGDDADEAPAHDIFMRCNVAVPTDDDLAALVDLCAAIDEALAFEHADNPARLCWTCDFVPFEPAAPESCAT